MATERPSDQLVDAKAILEALAELKRRGVNPVMEELESIEPDLAGHLMEELSLIYQELTRMSLRSKQIRKLYQQIESLTIVAILSLRNAQRRLWQDEPEADPPA